MKKPNAGRGRLRGDSRDSIHKLMHPNKEGFAGHDAHARPVWLLPILTIIALVKTAR